MKRISKVVLESKNACDEKVTIDLSHVEYIKEGKLAISGTVGTMIYFTSGNKLFVEEKYELVKYLLKCFRTGY